MTLPIIYLLLPEKSEFETDLRLKYSGKYNILHAHTGADALNTLNEHERVALFLVHQSLPDLAGTEFLAKASALFPDSRKVLLAEAKDTEAAITAINTLGIHYYLVQPWQSKHIERLDELLVDWQAISQPSYMYVRGVMNSHAARIREDSNLHIAAEIVALSGVSDLMVVNSAGGFIGVLSEGDILRTALPDIDDILEEGGTLEDAYQIFLRRGAELSNRPIAPLIIREPITLQPEDHVAKATAILVSKQIRLLPVVKDGRLLGTVSRANICEAVVGTLK
ncbi:MAG: CBS domain-containing protein [Chloroflexi bacterium]|nr:CBS domain-containing protein [Chloroflexota bacterium]